MFPLLFHSVMKLSGYRPIDTLLDDCLVFDSSVAEIQPSEAVPLLKHSSIPLSRQSFEMAPVHMSNSQVPTSDSLWVNSRTSPPVGTASKSSYFQIPKGGRFCIVIPLTFYSNMTFAVEVLQFLSVFVVCCHVSNKEILSLTIFVCLLGSHRISNKNGYD